MSFAKAPRPRGRNGRAAKARFVEVEMAAVVAGPMIIEFEGGGRILLSEPAHVTWLAQLLSSIAGYQEGGRP
jgi:hypothetical protein